MKLRFRLPWKIEKAKKPRGANLATRIVQMLYRAGGNPDVRLQIEAFVRAEGRELGNLGIEKINEVEIPEEER